MSGASDAALARVLPFAPVPSPLPVVIIPVDELVGLAESFFRLGAILGNLSTDVFEPVIKSPSPFAVGAAPGPDVVTRVVTARLLGHEEEQFFASDLAEELGLPLDAVEAALQHLANLGAVQHA
jgi:hypothetical protein